MKNQTLFATFVAILWLAGSVFAASNPAQVVIESERAFSKLAGEKGVRTAFLAYLAEDSLVFQDKPLPGRETYEKRPDNPGILFWQPVVADISAAGDVGYSTGPWEFSPKAGDKPVAYGQFASIWKKQADGSWKVAIDLGCSHGPSAKPVGELVNYEVPAHETGKSLAGVDASREKLGLLEADRTFSTDSANKGSVNAYGSWLISDARLLRNGMEPVSTEEARKSVLEKASGKLVWTPLDGGIAESGDLGYTYGTYSRSSAESAEEKGHYLRAWKRQKDGKWKVALDVLASIQQ